MKKLSSALLAGIAGGALLLAAAPAGASTTKGAGHTAPASPLIPSSLPAGYTVVTSGFLTATNGTQTHGSVTCPGTKQPSGGGALIELSALSANLNSSYPSGQGWAVDINNASGVDTTFRVYAICLRASLSYTVVTNSTVQGQLSTQSTSARCPAQRFVIGGGVWSSSLSTGVNINSSVANDLGNGVTQWTAAVSNATTTVPSYTVYAICRNKPTGYSIQWGGGVANTPGTEVSSAISCPGRATRSAGVASPPTRRPTRPST